MLIVGIEPFWGRAFVHDLSVDVVEDLSVTLVLGDDFAPAFAEAVDMFDQVARHLAGRQPAAVVVEVADCQSEATRRAIVAAGEAAGLGEVRLIMLETSRFLAALADLPAADRFETIAVVDVWPGEVFGYVLRRVPGATVKFRPCNYFALDSEGPLTSEQLSDFAGKLLDKCTHLGAVVIEASESNVDPDVLKNAFAAPGRDVLLRPGQPHPGVLVKGRVLLAAESGSIDVADTLQYALQLQVGGEERVITDAFAELPIVWRCELDVVSGTGIEIARRWPADDNWQLLAFLPLRPGPLPTKLVFDCRIGVGELFDFCVSVPHSPCPGLP